MLYLQELRVLNWIELNFEMKKGAYGDLFDFEEHTPQDTERGDQASDEYEWRTLSESVQFKAQVLVEYYICQTEDQAQPHNQVEDPMGNAFTLPFRLEERCRGGVVVQWSCRHNLVFFVLFFVVGYDMSKRRGRSADRGLIFPEKS